MVKLDWQTITPATSTRFMVNGTELARAMFPGSLSRFMIVSIRHHDTTENLASEHYIVRDAETVTLQDMAHGKRSKIVFQSEDYDAIIAYCAERC